MKWKSLSLFLFASAALIALLGYLWYANRAGTVTFPLVSDGIHLAYGQVVIGDETGRIIFPPEDEDEAAGHKAFLRPLRPLLFGHQVKRQETFTITLPSGRYTASFWAGEVCEEQDCVRLEEGVSAWGESFTVYPGKELILDINAEEVDVRARKAFADEARWFDEYLERRELERERWKNDPYVFPYSVDLLDACTERVCAANEACFDLMGMESCVTRCDGEYTGPCVKGWCKPFARKAPYDFAVCETEDETEDG